jgi:peptidyl-dipeptidase A
VIHNQDQVGGFIGNILSFQFYKSLCEAAGNKNDLSQCSLYNSKEAGSKLQAMLEMGNSRAWPQVMAKITGQTKLDGAGVVEYFQPLQDYLDLQNKNASCGW